MKKINFLYEFITPAGFLPIGYQINDLPIIFSESNDKSDGFFHEVIRMANDPNFRVSKGTRDLSDNIAEHLPKDIISNKVLIKDLTTAQCKDDHNLFVISSVHDDPFVDYVSTLDFDNIFTKTTFTIFKTYNSIKLILIDNKEGGTNYPDKFFSNIYNFTNKHNFKKNKIIFITNTSNIEEIYKNYLKRYELQSFMTCTSINFYIEAEPGTNIVQYGYTTDDYKENKIIERGIEYSLDNTPSLSIRDKYYLCLNRNSARRHRPQIILELIRNNLFDNGVISLLKSDAFDNFCELPENIEFKTKIKEKYPFVIDYENESTVANMHNYFTTKEMWNDTYFSIVTESSITGPSIFITEKIVRPMIYFHPFIVYGVPNTLTELRKLGFETFPEFFDESYDSIENDVERMLAIVQNVKRLCSLSIEELHGLYHSVYPKLIHNRNLLISMHKENLVGNKLLQLINL